MQPNASLLSEDGNALSNSNDVSILNYTMDEFIQSQLEDLEKIGTSGELFHEVWEEYQKQGKSLQQMQADLIQYQFQIEANLHRKKKKRTAKKRRHRAEQADVTADNEENKSQRQMDYEDDVMESSFISTPFKDEHKSEKSPFRKV